MLSIVIMLMVGLALFLSATRSSSSNSAKEISAVTVENPLAKSTKLVNAAVTEVITGNVQEPQGQMPAYNSQIDFVDSKTGYLTMPIYQDQQQTGFQLLKTVDGGHMWNSIYSGPDLGGLHFFSEREGVAIESSGNQFLAPNTMVATNDGGAHWQPLPSPFKVIIGLDCVNKNVMFVVAADKQGQNGDTVSRLYRTTDGGKEWQSVPLPQDNPAIGMDVYGYGINWFSTSEGFLLWCTQPATGMQPKTLYHTKDGGRTWIVQSSSGRFDRLNGSDQKDNKEYGLPLGGYAEGIEMFPDGTGYMGEGRGSALMTTDYGKTWQPLLYLYQSVDESAAPDFLNRNEGFALDRNPDNKPVIIHTADGGKTWELLWPPTQPFNLMVFSSARDGFGISEGTSTASQSSQPVLEKTSDGGLSWTRVGTIPAASIEQLGVQNGVLWAQVQPDPNSEKWSLLLSNDGGYTWQPEGGITGIRSLSVITLQMLYGLDGQDQLSRSCDAGRSWQEVPLPEPAMEISFSDQDHGWAVTKDIITPPKNQSDMPRFKQEQRQAAMDRKLLRTEDGGRTWQEISVSDGGFILTNVSALDARQVFVRGQYEGHSAILFSSDAGRHFRCVIYPDSFTQSSGFKDLEFISPSNIFATSFNDVFYRSMDGGLNFTPLGD
jgi:photosystem II stability/assembly factor-like uncharacterized protein